MHTSVKVLAAGLVAGVVVAGGVAFANAPEVVRASTQATSAEQHQPQASVVASATPGMARERAEEHGLHAQEMTLSGPHAKEAMRSSHRIEAVHAFTGAHEPEAHHDEHLAQDGTDHADRHGAETARQHDDGVASHDSSVTVHAGVPVERDQMHESGTTYRDSAHHSGDHR